jgi:hypothetical protein
VLVIGSLFELAAVPFLVKSRREGAAADTATALAPARVVEPPA